MPATRTAMGCIGAALLMGLLQSCGGASKTGVVYDPGQLGDTTISTPDGRITAVIPEAAASDKVRLTLVNRSELDTAVAGPEGRNLLMAVELAATSLAAPPSSGGGDGTGGTGGEGAGGTGSEPADVPLLSAAISITFHLPSPVPAGSLLPLHRFNSISKRYEDAGASTTLSADGLEAEFTTDTPARYAVYALLPSEYPPDPPTGLELVTATTLVRKLRWQTQADVLGYNLYRSPLGEDSFAKVNSELLTNTSYSDLLSNPGGYMYALTSVAPNALGEAGLESPQSESIESPNIDFDLAFTFGTDKLEHPFALTLDRLTSRLFIADPGENPSLASRGQIWVYTLEGKYKQQIESYGTTEAVTPRGMAFDPVYERLYVADAGKDFVYLLDASQAAGASPYALDGLFGSTGGGPGEFMAPSSVCRVGDKLIVGDRVNSQLQSFTPLGVHLAFIAQPGALNGQVSAPTCLLALSTGGFAVADDGNARVQVYKDDLSFGSSVTLATADGGPLAGLAGLAEDLQQQLYVSDGANRRVVVFDSGGKFLFHFGSEGSLRVEFGTDGPAGMAYDPDTGLLYIADPSNQRIAVFRT